MLLYTELNASSAEFLTRNLHQLPTVYMAEIHSLQTSLDAFIMIFNYEI